MATDDKAVAAAKGSAARHMKARVEGKNFAELGFLEVPVSFREVAHRITEWVGLVNAVGEAILAVDMGWGLETNSAMANFEKWMVVAEELADLAGLTVASLYNRRLLIDEQLLVALRGHPVVLTATGIFGNPHWFRRHCLRTALYASKWITGLARFLPSWVMCRRKHHIMPPKAPIPCGCYDERPTSRSPPG